MANLRTRRWVLNGVIGLLGLVIAGMLVYMVPNRFGLNASLTFSKSNRKFANPLCGYAPDARDADACAATQLVYIRLTWAQWEPEEGVFDKELLEGEYHVSQWREAGKRAVLRFVCDAPGDEEHRDIPDWLYERVGGGSFYHNSRGVGYSPDYENAELIAAHGNAVKALADYLGEGNFLAFVELGSLGHDGEWQAELDDGSSGMPGSEACWQYVLHYTDTMASARFLMRRNYVMASDAGLGVYFPNLGNADEVAAFVESLGVEGEEPAGTESLELLPLDDRTSRSIAGASFGEGTAFEEALDSGLPSVLEQVKNLRASYIGPNCPTGDAAGMAGAESLEKTLGYRLYVSAFETVFDFANNAVTIRITWENVGNAPFLWNWDAMVHVYGPTGDLIFWETTDLSLTQLGPGESAQTETQFPYSSDLSQGYAVGVSIEEPSGSGSVTLCMDDLVWRENVQMLYDSTLDSE